MQKFWYSIFYGIIWFFTLIPLPVFYKISDCMYYLIFYVVKYRKKVVYTNLRNAFPEKTEKEIDTIARKFYRHFCDTIVETFALVHISEKQIRQRFVYEGNEILYDLFEKGKNVSGIIGHYCNWEWTLAYPLEMRHKVLTIYKPLTSRFFDQFMISLRQKFSAKMIPMHSFYREVIKYEKEKIPAIFIFVSDQTPMRSEINYWTRFLNQDTAVYLGAEKIAKKMNHAVIFYRLEKVSRGHYKGFAQLLFEDVTTVNEREITEAHVKALEKVIIEKPEYWLWSHRRWKHKREN